MGVKGLTSQDKSLLGVSVEPWCLQDKSLLGVSVEPWCLQDKSLLGVSVEPWCLQDKSLLGVSVEPWCLQDKSLLGVSVEPWCLQDKSLLGVSVEPWCLQDKSLLGVSVEPWCLQDKSLLGVSVEPWCLQDKSLLGVSVESWCLQDKSLLGVSVEPWCLQDKSLLGVSVEPWCLQDKSLLGVSVEPWCLQDKSLLGVSVEPWCLQDKSLLGVSVEPWCLQDKSLLGVSVESWCLQDKSLLGVSVESWCLQDKSLLGVSVESWCLQDKSLLGVSVESWCLQDKSLLGVSVESWCLQDKSLLGVSVEPWCLQDKSLLGVSVEPWCLQDKSLLGVSVEPWCLQDKSLLGVSVESWCLQDKSLLGVSVESWCLQDKSLLGVSVESWCLQDKSLLGVSVEPWCLQDKSLLGVSVEPWCLQDKSLLGVSVEPWCLQDKSLLGVSVEPWCLQDKSLLGVSVEPWCLQDKSLLGVLRHFPVVSVKDILQTAKKVLAIQKNDSKGEQSNVRLGQVMVYLALTQSDLIQKAGDTELAAVTKSLLSVRKEKAPLHLVCTQTICGIITKVSQSQFTEHVWPALESDLSTGWEKCSPDKILMLLTATRWHPMTVDKAFLKSHWGCKRLVNVNTCKHIAQVYLQSTVNHPVIHPVCVELLTDAFQQSNVFPTFWKEVIDDSLLQQRTSKKYLCLHLVPHALKLSKSELQVSVILSPNLVACIMGFLANREHALHDAAEHLVQQLTSYVSSAEVTAEVKVAVVTALLSMPSGAVMDQSKSKLFSNLITRLDHEAADMLSCVLMKLVREETDSEEITPLTNLPTRWVIQQLCAMTTMVSMATDNVWQLKILQFLFLNSFFKVVEPTEDIPHCDRPSVPPLTDALRHTVLDGFFKVLSKLATFNTDKGIAKDHTCYIEVLHGLVKYAQTLLDNPQVAAPVKDFNEETREQWYKVVQVLSKIKAKQDKEKRMNEGRAFQLLYLHLGLQLFTHQRETLDVLKDLHGCYERAFRKRRMSIKKLDLTEPEWVEVITELLLSMLSEQSHLVRVVVNTVFRMLCPHMTTAALQLILDVFTTDTEDDGPLDFEDEEDEGSDSQEGEGEGEGKRKDRKEEEDESSDSDSDSLEEVEEEVDEELRSKVKAALGKGAVCNHEEEEDDDLSDSEMAKYDDALAAIFKKKGQGKKEQKEREVQLKHFKMRCLDLLITLVQSHPQPSLLLHLLRPLLELAENALKDKTMKDLGNKTINVLHHLCHPRKLPPDTNIDKCELPEMFKELLYFSAKVSSFPLINEVASACLFLVRVMLGLESNAGPSPMRTRAMKVKKDQSKPKQDKDIDNLTRIHMVLKDAIQEYCEKRDTNLDHRLFLCVLERQAALLWPVTDSLLGYVRNTDIRLFCRTQVCAMLAVMISKQSVQSLGMENWQQFAKELMRELYQVLQQFGEDNVKPRIMRHILFVMCRTLTSSSQDTIKDLVSEDLVRSVQKVKVMVNKVKDTRIMCNKLLGFLASRVSVPVDGSEKTKKNKKEKRQEENGEEFVTPKKKAKSSPVSPSASIGSSSSSKKKRKRERQNSTNGTELQPEQNGNLANGTAEETTIAAKSPVTNVDAQSHKKTSAKKRRKSNAGDNSLAMSSEHLNESTVKEADSSLHELTKKRRSLATLVGEPDTTGSSQKRKKNKTNSAA
ncbi:Myb-binding protein 1A-like protein [Lamellibrachia satsuma]|nr:Myb-binding protein 1A-like protein [Lamellibrachia satsuma]